jgi:hypothetical protein
MVVGATQCFFVVLLITGLIGLMRGWVREIITMAIVLGAVVFLLSGGGGLLHQFFFVNLPNAFHDLIFGNSAVSVAGPTVSTSTNTTGDYLFGLASFLGLMGLGYWVGHHYGTPPKTNTHRLGGVLPGLVNGAAMSYYTSQTILPSTQLDLTSPSGALTQMFLPIVLGLGLVGLILVLVVSALSKGGGSKGGSH